MALIHLWFDEDSSTACVRSEFHPFENLNRQAGRWLEVQFRLHQRRDDRKISFCSLRRQPCEFKSWPEHIYRLSLLQSIWDTLLAILLLPFIRCWCAVHLLWSTSPASPTWISWATASIRDSPTRRCVTASRTINAFQPPLRIFWDRASWTIVCSLGREHFMPLTPPTCDHAIYLSIICINIPGVLSKRKHDFDTEQSLFFCQI